MAILPLALADIVQVVIESSVLGQRCLNVLHYRARAAMPGETYQESMDALNQAVAGPSASTIRDKMLELMGDNTTIVRCQAQRVYPQRDIAVHLNVGTPGRSVAVCNAPNLSFVITKQGQTAGRGRNGSFHLAGVTDQHYALGFLTEGGIELMENVADKLNDPLVADGGEFVFEPGMFNPDLGLGFNWNYIVGTFPRDTVRVMRRRTVGLGI